MDAVLITGAGRRVGEALARGLGADGWFVVLHYNRSAAGAEAAAAAIHAAGGRAATLAGALDTEDGPGRLIARAVGLLPPGCLLTGLVNNASVFDYDDWERLTPAGLRAQFRVNFEAPLFLAQAFAKALPADRRGAIVNFLDQKLWNPNPLFFSYTLSKQALFGASDLLARALGPRIRVNAVAPGLLLRSGDQTPAEYDRLKTENFLGRQTELSDILGAVRYLLTAQAVTGQTLLVDGGEHFLPNDHPLFGSKHKG